MKSTKPALVLLTALLSSGVLLGHVPDRNAIPNWPVPATWSPPRPAGMVGTMTDISLAIPFVAITPCRIADTRAGQGFSGQAGPPILNTGTRTFQIAGTVTTIPTQCGIPVGADAVSFQFTIVTPNTAGNLIAWPAGGVAPTVSVLNWSAGEIALGNGTIVPISAGGALSVRINAAVGSAVGDLVLDVNGYFSDAQNAGEYFSVSGSRGGPMILGENIANALNADGVRGTTTAAAFDTAGVRGVNLNSGFRGYGVFGSHAGNGYGVYGESATAEGVVGSAVAINRAGVLGFAVSAGPSYGVIGNASGAGSVGVLGQTSGLPNISGTVFSASGVRGESNGTGAIGISEATGVGGFLMNPVTGITLAEGRLGTTFGTDPDGFGPPWGVHAIGQIGATGTKAFLEPHPTEPGKVIQYVALEGPEAGTYFRGKARFQRGLAKIAVPEDFRMVTDPEGLTVQITPIGGMASFGVLKMDLNEIVVQGSRDFEFSYLVQGVRASFKDLQPVIRDGTFVPQSASAKIPSALAERQKRVLIETGIYKPDGSVNMETARRLGWDKMWEKRGSPGTAVTTE